MNASIVSEICLTIIIVVLIVCITIYNIRKISAATPDAYHEEENDDDYGRTADRPRME